MLLKPSKNGFNHELGKLPLSYFTPTRSLEGCSHGVAAPSYYGCLTQQIIKRKSRQTPKQTRLNWRQVNNLCCLCRGRVASVLTMKSPVGPSKTREDPGWKLVKHGGRPCAERGKKKRAFARLMRFEPSHTFLWNHRGQNRPHLRTHTERFRRFTEVVGKQGGIPSRPPTPLTAAVQTRGIKVALCLRKAFCAWVSIHFTP